MNLERVERQLSDRLQIALKSLLGYSKIQAVPNATLNIVISVLCEEGYELSAIAQIIGEQLKIRQPEEIAEIESKINENSVWQIHQRRRGINKVYDSPSLELIETLPVSSPKNENGKGLKDVS